MQDNEAKLNTDVEVWREVPGDYYSPSIFVTERGGVGMNVGGLVIVKPIREWFALAKECAPHTALEASSVARRVQHGAAPDKPCAECGGSGSRFVVVDGGSVGTWCRNCNGTGRA